MQLTEAAVFVCVVVPVKVTGKNSDKVVETYAFLDNDSDDVTLCDQKLVREVELDGIERKFSLTTQAKRDRRRKGLEVQLRIEAMDGNDTLDLQRVWTVKQLNVSQRSITTAEDVEHWKHLSGGDRFFSESSKHSDQTASQVWSSEGLFV